MAPSRLRSAGSIHSADSITMSTVTADQIERALRASITPLQALSFMTFVLLNLVIDILYSLLDPRVRLGAGAV